MSWKDIFKSKEQRALDAAVMEAHIRQQVADEMVAQKARDEYAAKVEAEQREAVRKQVEADLLAEKLNSTTPWYEAIIGAEDATHVNERYRWNQAFIRDLIKKGHEGDSDNQLFQSFLDRQVEEDRQRIITEEREKKRLSAEPWVEVIGEHIDADGRIELQLDWNAAFVKYLRLNGFRGATDDVLVQLWLAALQKDTTGEEYH